MAKSFSLKKYSKGEDVFSSPPSGSGGGDGNEKAQRKKEKEDKKDKGRVKEEDEAKSKSVVPRKKNKDKDDDKVKLDPASSLIQGLPQPPLPLTPTTAGSSQIKAQQPPSFPRGTSGGGKPRVGGTRADRNDRPNNASGRSPITSSGGPVPAGAGDQRRFISGGPGRLMPPPANVQQQQSNTQSQGQQLQKAKSQDPKRLKTMTRVYNYCQQVAKIVEKESNEAAQLSSSTISGLRAVSGNLQSPSFSNSNGTTDLFASMQTYDEYDFFDTDDDGNIVLQPKIPIFPEDFTSDDQKTEWPLSWWGIVDPSIGERKHLKRARQEPTEDTANTKKETTEEPSVQEMEVETPNPDDQRIKDRGSRGSSRDRRSDRMDRGGSRERDRGGSRERDRGGSRERDRGGSRERDRGRDRGDWSRDNQHYGRPPPHYNDGGYPPFNGPRGGPDYMYGGPPPGGDFNGYDGPPPGGPFPNDYPPSHRYGHGGRGGGGRRGGGGGPHRRGRGRGRR